MFPSDKGGTKGSQETGTKLVGDGSQNKLNVATETHNCEDKILHLENRVYCLDANTGFLIAMLEGRGVYSGSQRSQTLWGSRKQRCTRRHPQYE